MLNYSELYAKLSRNFWRAEQVSSWVEQRFFRKAIHRQTSDGSQHAALPIVLDDNGHIDGSLLGGDQEITGGKTFTGEAYKLGVNATSGNPGYDLYEDGVAKWRIEYNVSANRLQFTEIGVATHIRIEDTTGKVGIGASPGAKLHVDQDSSTAEIPVLILDQADVSEEFIRFVSAIGAGQPIQNGALGTYYGKFRVHVEGVGDKWVPLYNS